MGSTVTISNDCHSIVREIVINKAAPFVASAIIIGGCETSIRLQPCDDSVWNTNDEFWSSDSQLWDEGIETSSSGNEGCNITYEMLPETLKERISDLEDEVDGEVGGVDPLTYYIQAKNN